MIKAIFPRLLAGFPVGALLIGLSLPANAQPSNALEFGIVPYLPTPTILERYKPLRIYLERRLHEPVSIVTAPDYASFIERTQRREYPFVITVSHAARLAELEAGYQPMLRPGWDFYAILLVRKDSAFQDIKDLRGKTIATPGPYAVVSQLGANWLRKAGLKPDQDVTLQPNPTHTAALHAVVEGAADAAFISNRAFVAVKSDLKDRVRSLGQAKESGGPSVVYMAHPALTAQRVAAVKAAILAFVQTPEGKEFVASLGYDTLREMKPGELAILDPYVRELKQVMAADKPAKQ
ncbi:MAG: phosphate/phosphite/phosphonate ABC transporter substrate-binding protein [Hydrogenophilales bacterium]|nr:phosphate/phosphite/phosphonate ABC transporter substrate-binding protein [Hydrogenophilales bacterium]